MSAQKQLINLLGTIVVLAILAIGVVAFALPLYSNAQATDSQIDQVEATNTQYEVKIKTLRFAEASIDARKQDLDDLREQIALPNHLDEVFEIAVKAADDTDATLTDVSAGEITPFQARTDEVADGTEKAPKKKAKSSGSDGDGTASSTGSAEASDTQPTPGPDSAPDPDARTQAAFTLTVSVDSPQDAIAFLDELRGGPRLIAITHTALSGGSGSADDADQAYTLTVDATTFMRKED